MYILVLADSIGIKVEQHRTLEEAQAEMLYELEDFAEVENPRIGFEDSDCVIQETSAWVNYDRFMEWLIVKIEPDEQTFPWQVIGK